MHHKIVHAGERTLYTWWKSMIEVAIPGTVAQVLLQYTLHWAQASSGQRAGLMTRRQGVVIAGSRQTAIIITRVVTAKRQRLHLFGCSSAEYPKHKL